MSTQAKPLLTPEEYLEIERKAEYKSEYYQGEMFAMSGATLAHNQLAATLTGELYIQLRSGPCSVLPSDMRVLVNKTGLYTYPDLIVVCGAPKLLDSRQDTLLNPTLLVEVLSPSTEAYDRGRKFAHYRSIESLQAYLLLATDRVQADLYTRQPDERWLLTSIDRLEAAIELECIGCRIEMAVLYERLGLANVQ